MLELEHRFRVVDVHARLDPAEDVSERGRAISPERLEREMHQAGVVRSVVFPGQRPGTDYLKYNNAVARLSVDRPFIAFARISGALDPGESPASKLRNLAARRGDDHVSPGDIEQYAYDDRFYGFRLDPARDGLPDEAVLDELEAVGLPLLVDAGEGFPPSALDATLLQYDVPVIASRFGGHPSNRELMDSAIDLLDRHEDFYLDTSFVRYRELLERALLEHPDRVLFGSGAPNVHPNVGVMELLTLDLSEDKMRKAFSRNPSRVVPALGSDGER
ncbi:MAG: putative TIM-barrel fold metal-dependent hydrolase [Halobacteriales archaeon]|jgi:predicted TIM-barrel fold metal-dependent hydrolase